MTNSTGRFAIILVLLLPACFAKPTFEAVQKGKVELEATERKTLETLLSSAGLPAADVRVFKDTSDWVTDGKNGALIESGHVTRLRIEGTGLEEIPEVDSLTRLTHLELGDNRISKIGDLPDTLVELSLRSNEITQIHSLEDLPELEILYLQDNAIVKIAGLDDLASLKQLDLGGNEIEIMEGLSGLTSLWSLRLTGNRITRIQGLEGLVALDHIDLSENLIASIEPLAATKSLTSISIAKNKLEGSLDVSGFENLERLNVRDNALAALSGVEKLEFLDASGNSIEKKPEGVERIATLYLTGNPCESTPGKDTMPKSWSGTAGMTSTKCVMGNCTGKIGKLTGSYRLDSSGPDRDVRVTLSVGSGQVKVYLEQQDGSAMSVTASSGAPVTIEGRTTDQKVGIEAPSGTARDVSYRIDNL